VYLWPETKQNEMNSTEIIGMVAAALTTISFVPQAIKTMKTKRTHDISLIMYVLFVSGVAMWLIYGLKIESNPVIIANSVTLFLIVPILILKLIYK
jgi:MtN3 and saliva related transmembrane protein